MYIAVHCNTKFFLNFSQAFTIFESYCDIFVKFLIAIHCWPEIYIVLLASHLFSGPVQRVIYSYEMTAENHPKVVAEMISDWTAMCNLYTIVRQFADAYNGRILL